MSPPTSSSARPTIHFMIDLSGCGGALGRKHVHNHCMQVVTSPRNPLLKEVRKAVLRGSLTGQGLCVAEGFHLLEEALRSDCEIPAIFAAESARGAVESH